VKVFRDDPKLYTPQTWLKPDPALRRGGELFEKHYNMETEI